jgi:penicillin amidase
MSKKKALFYGFLWVVLLIIILLLFLAGYAVVSTRNPTSGTLALEGLDGKVLVIRDEKGIPFIKALKDDRDAFFALGFVTAQDRYWQMEVNRRVVQGRLSELFGKDTLETDRMFRALQLRNAAQSSWSSLSLATQRAMEAYTNGINAFLKTGNLPLQVKILRYTPDLWTVQDIIGIQKLMSLGLSNDFMLQWENAQLLKAMDLKKLIRLRGSYPDDAITTVTEQNQQHHSVGALNTAGLSYPANQAAPLPSVRKTFGLFKPGVGSNAWVIDGTRTVSGKPLLASDPHMDFNMPGDFYLASMQGPGLDVRGATMPGLPFVLIGHNQKIAWGITNARIETSAFKVFPSRSHVTSQDETIKIRGGNEEKLRLDTISGLPVFNPFLTPKPEGQYLALETTVRHPDDSSLDSFYLLQYASDWKAFRHAMSRLVSPALNVLYADEEGNIAYQLAGSIPLREKTEAANGDYTPISASPEGKPVQYIPFLQLPSIINPPNHILISANNKIVPDSYPWQLTRFWDVPPFRAERIRQLFQEKSALHALSPQDMATIQYDTRSLDWQLFKPLFKKAMQGVTQNREALRILLDWDGNMQIDSTGSTIYSWWLREMILANQKIYHLNYWFMEPLAVAEQLRQGSTAFCSNPSECDESIRRFFAEGMVKMYRELGNDPKKWQWGKLHKAIFRELAFGEVPLLGNLWNRSIAAPGGQETVNPGYFEWNDFSQYLGSSYRQIIDLGNSDNNRYIIPTGQSDSPFNSNHGNLMPAWQKGDYISLKAPIHSKNVLVLVPWVKSEGH